MKFSFIVLIGICHLMMALKGSELEVFGEQFGAGKHKMRTADEIKLGQEFVISDFDKENYTYLATATGDTKILFSKFAKNSLNPTKENLFEFNKKFGSESPSVISDAFIVDVYEQGDKISFVLLTNPGYVFLTISRNIKPFTENSLILPPDDVNKSPWNVIKRTSFITQFSMPIEEFRFGRNIKSIKLKSLFLVEVEFKNEDGENLFDFSGDVIMKNSARIEDEKLHNPTCIHILEFIKDLERINTRESHELRVIEKSNLKDWITNREGGKEHLITELQRFKSNPDAARAIEEINKLFLPESKQ